MKNQTLKYTIIKVTFCIASIFSVFAFTNSPNENQFRIKVGFDFGRGSNCTGRGLCAFTNTERSSNDTFDALGYYVVDEDGKTSLKIDKNTISYSKAQEQFTGEDFEVSNTLSMKNSSQLKLPNGVLPIIEKGTYSVREDNNFMLLSFNKK